MKSSSLAFIAAAALAAVASPSSAALVTYTAPQSGFTYNSDTVDPAFNAALGSGYTHLSFSGATNTDGSSYSSAVTFSTKVGIYGGSNTSLVNASNEIGPYGTWDGVLNVAFTTPVSVVGFGLVEFNGPNEVIRVYSDTDVLLGTFTDALPSLTFSMWGVSATAGERIGRIELDGNFFAIQDISFNVASGVPEASTWIMMLAGFAGLGFAAYRSTRKATLAA